MSLPDGFSLKRENSEYELSWVNWRVHRTRFPYWLVFAFTPFLVVVSLILTTVIVRSGLVSVLGWLALLCWIFPVATLLGPVSLFFRETIHLGSSGLTYRTRMPLTASFGLRADEITKVALEDRRAEDNATDSGISTVLCVVHVATPERILETNRFAHFTFYALRALLPFGRRWFRMPRTATGWFPGPCWAPTVNAQVFELLRHLFSEMQWQTEFEASAEVESLLEEYNASVTRKTLNHQMQPTGVPPSPDL